MAATDDRAARAARLAGLYAVTPDLDDTAALVAKCAAAIDGGARAIQYRHKTASAALREAQARAIVALCRERGALSIVNDDAALAERVGADGVHVGEEDGGVASARAIVGPARIVGASCYDALPRAVDAVAEGADYVAFGSFFASGTKPGARRAALDLVPRARALGVPIVAIGGIDADNVRELVDAGVDAVAVISAVFAHDDPRDMVAASRRIVAAFSARDSAPPVSASAASARPPRGRNTLRGEASDIRAGGIMAAAGPGEAPARPLVSVITRTLGRSTLPEAAACVAAQTWRPLEWVVVDAAGTGLVPPAAGDVPVRVVSTGERLLRGVAANAGMRAARGEWLMLFDDDDLIRPEHVARLVEAVAAEPGHRIAYADVAAPGYLLDYADVEMWLADGKRAHVFDVPYSPLLLSKDNLFPPMAALFSARLVREHGCAVDETLDFFEDWDFWRQVAQHTDFLRVPGITAVYRANLSASGVTGEGSPSADPRISRDREKVAQRLAALRDRYQRRVDELKAEARSARNAGDADRALAAWREAGRIDPYDVDAVLREAEAACAAGAWAEGRRAIAEALARMPGEPTLLRNLAIVDRATRRGAKE